MGLKRSLLFGLGVVIIASSYCFANTVIDDFDDGNNKSKIQKYWYFYTDYDNNGTSSIYGVQDKPQFEGGYDGKDGTYGAVMEFTLGDTAGMKDGCKPYVAMGLNFAEGSNASGRYPYDLTGADSISFYIKGDKAFTARLYMELTTVKNWDDFFHSIDVTTSWQHVSIPMKKDAKKGFKQNGWDEDLDLDFDLTKVAKMNFRVRWEENPELTEGTLFIDSVVMVGDAKFPKEGTIKTEDVGTFPSKGLLNNFDGGKKKNTLGFSWYAYDDGTLDGGSSVFTSGYDEETKQLLVDATGGYDNTEGIALSVTLGDMIPNESDPKNPIAPFCGIGTTLGDATNGYFDASSGTGVYLNYKSDIDVDMELVDSTTRNDGIAFHVVLPSTGGEWKQAKALFSAFILPDWVNVDDLTDEQATLNKKVLSKLQFKISGDAKTDANFAIDNIYFDGVSIVGVLPLHKKLAAKGINYIQTSDVIRINFSNTIGNAKVSMINPLGKVVYFKNINNLSRSCSIPLFNNTSGVYVLKIAGNNGLIEVAPINIVK